MKYRMPVVDSHYHIYDWFGVDGREFWDSTLDYCNARDFKTININALPSVKRDVSNNIIAALYKLRHPGIFAHGGLTYEAYPVPEVLPPEMDPLTQYKELMEIGFDGIKMLEAKPTEIKAIGRLVCDKLYEPFFAAIERDGTHMVWHSGDPDSFWDPAQAQPWQIERGWFYGDGTYPTYEEIYAQVDAVLEKHPNLNVTFAHFFFLSGDPLRLERDYFAKYPNVNVDLTPGVEMYGSFGKDPAYFRDFFTRYADRIEYGTDCSNHRTIESNMDTCDPVYAFLTTDADMEHWSYRFKGLNLEEKVLEKILGGNFLRRVSETPKPINQEALKAYAAKYRHLIRDERVRALIDEELAAIQEDAYEIRQKSN